MNDPEGFSSGNHLCLFRECEDVDKTGAVREHLGQGVLPQAGLHKLAARHETPSSAIHLSENLLCPRSSNLSCFFEGGSCNRSRSHHLENGSRYLGHLLRVYHAIVVNVKEPKGPGKLLLLAAVGDDVQGEHVLAEVDDAVAVAVKGAKDMAAEGVGTMVREEHRVPGMGTIIYNKDIF